MMRKSLLRAAALLLLPIGAAGMAGVVLLYEEVKREAAQENLPEPPPTSGASLQTNAP